MKDKRDPIAIAGDMENYKGYMSLGLSLAVICFIGAWIFFDGARYNEERAEKTSYEPWAEKDLEDARQGRNIGTCCSIFGLIGLIVCFAYYVQFQSVNPYPKKWGLFNLTEEVSKISSRRASEERTIQKERRKQWVEYATITALFEELDNEIEKLRRSYSTKTEQIVVGHKTVNKDSIFQHDVAQYAARTREVPETRVEKMIKDSIPGDIELEIIRRGTNVLDDLIGKYRSGENLEITKRILKKLPAGEVGGKFEEYGMLEEAENWYASNKLLNDAKRLREKMRFKLDQTVVHGDYVDDRDTIIKDSVVSKSNVGAGGDDKVAKLEKIANLKREGLIDDDEFKQMKKEILGK